MAKVISASDDHIKGTTQEIGQLFGIQDYTIAAGLLKFLVAQKVAHVVDTRPNIRGKGRASNIYQIPAKITIDFE